MRTRPLWSLPGGCEPSRAGCSGRLCCEPRDGDSPSLTSPGAKQSSRLPGKSSSSTVACADLHTESPFCSDTHGHPRSCVLSMVCSLPLGSETPTPEPQKSFPPTRTLNHQPGASVQRRSCHHTTPADARPALHRDLSSLNDARDPTPSFLQDREGQERGQEPSSRHPGSLGVSEASALWLRETPFPWRLESLNSQFSDSEIHFHLFPLAWLLNRGEKKMQTANPKHGQSRSGRKPLRPARSGKQGVGSPLKALPRRARRAQ